MRTSLRHAVAIGLASELTAPLFPLPLPPPPAKRHESKRHTLVLDIDETLIYTYADEAHPKDQRLRQYHVFLRPHVSAFLIEVQKLFDVVFWTAGTASYCAAIINMLETFSARPESPHYSALDILARMDASAGAPNSAATSSATSATTVKKKQSISAWQAQQELLAEHAAFQQKDASMWVTLSRSQTLEEYDYMKYIPLLGRDPANVVMLDDNTRSFPLTPRSGVKIVPFCPNRDVLNAMATAEGRGENASTSDAVHQGKLEIQRLESDDELLKMVEILRCVASASCATRELDHWRSDDYVNCDYPAGTVDPYSRTRRKVLGSVMHSRRQYPIPPQRPLGELLQEDAGGSAAAVATMLAEVDAAVKVLLHRQGAQQLQSRKLPSHL